jgi:ATP-dependent Clp protease adaptor protein ClpS
MVGLSEERQSGVAAGAATREPRRFHVILHNDNYTTMEFVVDVLVSIFRKTAEEAAAIMLAVHEKGRCSCGVYTEEMAETKVAQVRHKARQAGFPLRCSMEEA